MLVDFSVQPVVVFIECQQCKQRIFLEQVVRNHWAREEIGLSQIAQLVEALEQEEELRLQGKALLVLVEAAQEGVQLGLLEQQLRVDVRAEASRKTGLAGADGALDHDVAGCGEGSACRHEKTANDAGSVFQEKGIGARFAVLGQSFEAQQHSLAGGFHVLAGVHSAREVAGTTGLDGCPAMSVNVPVRRFDRPVTVKSSAVAFSVARIIPSARTAAGMRGKVFGVPCSVGELAHFVGNDGETATGFTRAGSRVEGQE
jgi:hypothetical protein